MGWLRRVKDRLIRWQHRRLVRYLSTARPERIVAAGQRRLLRAFRRAARQVPAYRRLLAERGIAPAEITTVRKFRRHVPVLDKHAVFEMNDLPALCAGGTLEGVRLLYTSSGHSGTFSFGVETPADAERAAMGLEFLLDRNFGILRRKTFIINCTPMGVKVPVRSVPAADTSVRADSVLALIDKLAGEFEQFVLLGEAPFLKKVIEDGAAAGVPWHDLVVHLVTGGEYVPENWRTYLGHLLDIDFDNPDRGMIGLNMGLSELSLSLFSETPQTLRIRRAAQSDPRLRHALFGDGIEVCPEVMQYFPGQIHVEALPGPSAAPELVVSMLDPRRRIPLIRYNTGDAAWTMDYRRLEAILAQHDYGHLLPELHLPVAFIWGRRRLVPLPAGGHVSPVEVKEALYKDFDIAGALTGNFTILTEDDCGRVLVQLKPGVSPAWESEQRLAEILSEYVRSRAEVKLVAYEQFPHGLEHNYEKKNHYVAGATEEERSWAKRASAGRPTTPSWRSGTSGCSATSSRSGCGDRR